MGVVQDNLSKEAKDYVLENYRQKYNKLIAAELRIVLLPNYPNFEEGMYGGKDIDEMVSDGYIPIANEVELDNIRNNAQYIFGAGTKWEKEYVSGLDKKYIVVGDLNLSNHGDYTPVGSMFVRFSGVFDGGGYNIENLRVDANNYSGLFGYVDGGSLKNINLVKAEVKGNSYVGGLVGRQNNKSIIENCFVSGEVVGVNNVGGMVGYQSDSTLSMIHSEAIVEGERRVGGLVGRQVSSNINRSYSVGLVEGEIDVGGLAGGQLSSSIENSYSSSLVKSDQNVGGVVGTQLTSSVVNSYAVGEVVGDSNTGGIVGSNWLSSVSNGYYDRDTTGQSGGWLQLDGYPRSTQDMKTRETYTSWDFDSIWSIDDGDYPKLQ